MKRINILSLGTLVAAAMLGTGCQEEQADKVLLIVPEDSSADLEYMLSNEVAVMTDMLEQAAYDVAVATASGEPLVADETTLTPDLKFSDIEMTNYDGVVMPCLAAADDARSLPPELAAMIREAVADGKPVAAQTGGIITLASAGVLTGKKFAYVEEWAPEVPLFEDAVYSGNGVVEDGNIITSGVCPYAARMLGLQDGTAGLIEALIDQMRSQEHP
jgi:putative intracellular protease/amidase